MTNKKKSCSWTRRTLIFLALISIAGVAGIAFGVVSEKTLPLFCSFIILWHIFDIFDFYNLIFDLNTISKNKNPLNGVLFYLRH